MRDQLDLPIEYNPSEFGYYYTEEVIHFPSMQISEKDLFSLFIAQKAMVEYRGTEIERPLAGALERLTAGLRDEVTVHMQDWESAFSFRSAGASIVDVKRFDLLSHAIRKQEAVRFQYRGLQGKEFQRREVDPYHLTCVDQLWYLLGYDHHREAIRTYALTRMRELESTGSSFEKPDDFSPEDLLSGSFGVFSDTGDYSIELRFDSFAAKLISERQWHESQQITQHRSGELTLKLKLGSLPEIARWVLGWGSHVQVIGPAELKKQIRDDLMLALGHYDKAFTSSVMPSTT